jgi:ABC-type sugar transport system ATPase subunit
VEALSVAEKRLVMIARALHARAQVLVLDEPTAALTDSEIRRLHGIVRRLRDQGRSVVYVSHRLDEIMALTDRVIVMRDGEVVLTTSTRDITRAALIEAITGGGVTSTAGERRRLRGVGGPPDAPVALAVRGLAREPEIAPATFELRRGEILGFAGLVGSGRTELARLLFGADRATAGTIVVDGRPVAVTDPKAAKRHGIALLPEERRRQGLVLDFNLAENVSLAALERFRPRRLPFPSRDRERAAAGAVIDRLSVRATGPDQPITALSGGSQQKVVLGKWLQRDPLVYIFDEPSAGIDIEAKEQIYELIEGLAADGKAVIFISSEFSELVGVCQRVLVFREGRIVGELAGDAVTERGVLELCYDHGA